MADLIIDLTAPNGVKYRQPLGLFINNDFIPSASGEQIESIDPSNESKIATVQTASSQDIDKAVQAAQTAFKDPSWGDISGTDRGVLLSKLAALTEERLDTLATIETWDNGKPLTAAKDDIAEVIQTLRYYAGWADKIYGDHITTDANKLVYTVREPIGVCAQIIPWNYPLGMAAWKLGPALATGNTVVLKPAEQTPLSILYFATLIPLAGFPPGVINIVNGLGPVAGAALASHPKVSKIAFTGSTATARQITKMAAINLKNITLETGGKSPLLVFADANLDQAVKWSHMGIMSNSGQICTATSRILVESKIYDDFVRRFKEATASTSKIGDPFDAATYQGPQVSKAQFERVLRYVATGKEEGATLEMGGQASPPTNNNINNNNEEGKGFFIAPTVFTHVEPWMKIYREEVFGPFAVISSFGTEEEALQRANDTEYGLSAAVFTEDLRRAHRVAKRLEAGTVWINSSQDSDIRVPFGGYKQSGIGRELGEEGLRAYTQTKAVHVNMGNEL